MDGLQNLEGSGPVAMLKNVEALKEIEESMKGLRERAANGENVDVEFRELVRQKSVYMKDKGLIHQGGM